VSFACKAKGKAGTSSTSAASRSPRGRQTPSTKRTSPMPAIGPFCCSKMDCRCMRPFACIITLHGTAHQTRLLLLLLFPSNISYTPHGTCSTPSRPISRTCIAAEHARATIVNVARRGKIRPHVYLSIYLSTLGRPPCNAMPYIVPTCTVFNYRSCSMPACLLTGRIEC
jgi:hypothetical protein